jgi:hypothetical protein
MTDFVTPSIQLCSHHLRIAFVGLSGAFAVLPLPILKAAMSFRSNEETLKSHKAQQLKQATTNMIPQTHAHTRHRTPCAALPITGRRLLIRVLFWALRGTRASPGSRTSAASPVEAA